jgi:hypothetical protein
MLMHRPDPNTESVDDDRPAHPRMDVAIVSVSPGRRKGSLHRDVRVVPIDVARRAVAGVEEDVVRHRSERERHLVARVDVESARREDQTIRCRDGARGRRWRRGRISGPGAVPAATAGGDRGENGGYQKRFVRHLVHLTASMQIDKER